MPYRAKIASLAQGISRQGSGFTELGRPSTQDNYYPNPVLGLQSRPPSQHVKQLFAEAGPNVRWHLAAMRETEQYWISVKADGVRVFDVAGEEYPVINSGNYSYLRTRTSNNPVLNPETFNTGGWDNTVSGLDSVTLSTATNISPFGALNGTKIAVDGSGAKFGGLDQIMDGTGGKANLVFTAGQKYVFSVYVKAPQQTGQTYSIAVSLLDAAGTQGVSAIATYSVATGGWSKVTNGTLLVSHIASAVEPQGNGWARIWLAVQINAAQAWTGDAVRPHITCTTGAGATGTGREFYAFGARIDQGRSDPLPYLSDPSDSYELLTAKDFTYILNKKTPVFMESTTSTAEVAAGKGDGKFWLWVRSGQYLTDYQVAGRVADSPSGEKDFTVTASTWKGSAAAATEISSIKTNDIANELATAGFTPGPSATNTGLEDQVLTSAASMFQEVKRIGSVIQVETKSANRLTEEPRVIDSQGGTALVLISTRVQSEGDLPAHGFTGKKVILDPDPGINAPVSYRISTAALPDQTTGEAAIYWPETIGFGIKQEIDQDTMPHGLTRMVDNAAGSATGFPYRVYFVYAPITWDQRLVGDDDTNPIPSFVSPSTTDERTIRNLFFFRNRLGFLSRDNVVLSETGVFTNFFRTTVEFLPTTDPIDARSNTRKVREFDSAIETTGRLLLKSEDVIMEVGDSGQLLTAETITIDPVLDVHSDTLAAPVATGPSVIFTDRLQRFTQAVEILPSGDSDRFFPIGLTDDTLDLISPRIRHLAVSPMLGLAVLVPEAPDSTVASPTVYCYSYLWAGPQEKLQSAWWTLTLGSSDTVRHADFFEDTLYLIVERDGTTVLEKIVFDLPKQISTDWLPIVDGLLPLTALSPVFGGTNTTIVAPFELISGYSYVFVYSGTVGQDKGDTVALTVDTATNTWTAPNVDLTSEVGWIGRVVPRTFTFNEYRPKEDANIRGRHSFSNAEVLYHELILSNLKSIEYQVKVTGNRTYTYTFSSDTGSGDPPLSTSQERFTCNGESSRLTLTIQNSSPRPECIQSGDLLFSLRARGRSSRL